MVMSAAGVDGPHRNVIETLRGAGADVENARLPGMIEEEQVDVDRALDRYETAALLAVAIAAAALEQPDPAVRPILVEEMKRDRRHAPLVLLALAIDVEIAQADHLRRALRPVAAHVLIEQELGIAVDVERRFARAVFAGFGAGAGDRPRRRINVRNFLVDAIFEQLARVLVIILHHVAAL